MKSSGVCKEEVRIPVEMELIGSYSLPPEPLTAEDYAVYVLGAVIIMQVAAIVFVGSKLDVIKNLKIFGLLLVIFFNEKQW